MLCKYVHTFKFGFQGLRDNYSFVRRGVFASFRPFGIISLLSLEIKFWIHRKLCHLLHKPLLLMCLFLWTEYQLSKPKLIAWLEQQELRTVEKGVFQGECCY